MQEEALQCWKSVLRLQESSGNDFRSAEGEAGMLGIGKLGARNGRCRPGEFQLHKHVTSWSEGPGLEFRRRELERDKGFE